MRYKAYDVALVTIGWYLYKTLQNRHWVASICIILDSLEMLALMDVDGGFKRIQEVFVCAAVFFEVTESKPALSVIYNFSRESNSVKGALPESARACLHFAQVSEVPNH